MIKKAALVLFFFLCTERLCHLATDGFTIRGIFRTEDTIDISAKTPIPTALTQEFSYLGRGAQCYAFESQDSQYVLKFFRRRRLAKSKERKERYFTSCILAEKHLKEETGLEYLHLHPDDIGMLRIKDKLGIVHTISTKNTPFILQKKATPFYQTLKAMSHNPAFIEKTRSSLKDLIAKRCAEGICDKDPDLATNFGFVGERLIQFDIGRYYKAPLKEQEEMDKLLRPLEQWIK